MGRYLGDLVCGYCNACCRWGIALSQEEANRLNDGERRMKLDADGWCQYTDKTTRLCMIYEERPQICRRFDCREHVENLSASIEVRMEGVKRKAPGGDG